MTKKAFPGERLGPLRRSSDFQILFYFGQPGVGPGDEPGVFGYLLRPVSLAEGFIALFGPAPGDPVHAGGACDSRQRSPEVVVFMHEPVFTRDDEVQPCASGRTAYDRSRSLGVGAGIIRHTCRESAPVSGPRGQSCSCHLCFESVSRMEP